MCLTLSREVCAVKKKKEGFSGDAFGKSEAEVTGCPSVICKMDMSTTASDRGPGKQQAMSIQESAFSSRVWETV